VDRTQKEELVSTLRDKLNDSSLIVVTQQSGLTVAEVTDLRSKVREAGAEYKVMKNTLARLSVAGTKNEEITSLFNGPTALAYSADPVAAAKAVVDFSNDNDKLKVVGGIMDGQFLDASGVVALSKMPSLDELRGKLVALLVTPATQIARITKEPAGQLARVIGAYGNSA
jgi:large subunit ribosomal protein L10